MQVGELYDVPPSARVVRVRLHMYFPSVHSGAVWLQLPPTSWVLLVDR